MNRGERRRVPPSLLLLVALGGAIGSVARVALVELVDAGPGRFPWATWGVNVTGAFLLALLVAAVVELDPPAWRLRALVGTGLLGAFTTFSSFAAEAVLLVREGEPALAATYVAATIVVGLPAATGGAHLATVAGRRARR